MHIQKTALCKNTQSIFEITKKKKEQKRKLITKKERAKEQGKRVIRCELPSLGPIIKGTSKTSKQMVIRFIYILESVLIAFPPNAPHQIQRN